MDNKLFEDNMSDTSIRTINAQRIKKDTIFQKYLSEIRLVEEFWIDFGFLSFGRDYIVCRKWSFSLQCISVSLEITLGNIISCCKYAAMADANTLLRKYRDDMFFYLYMSVYNSRIKTYGKTIYTDEMEENIQLWICNKLNDLRISTVLKAIASSSQLSEIIKKYNMQKSFNTISSRLNNFVHSNGYTYYNQNINACKDNELPAQLKQLLDDILYITVTFLTLLTLCSPLSIMSSDYTDYLDFNDTPPECSQYLVAPFVERFLNKNSEIIDKGCLEFLRQNTMMEI